MKNRMKIAYILDDDISTKTGIVKKIESKINIWNKLDHEVKVFSLRSKDLEPVIDEGIILSQFNNQSSLIQKTLNQFKNTKILDHHLSIFQPDVIYMRYMKYYPNMVKVLKKHAPYIVEINSNDVEEQKLNRKTVYMYNKLTRNYLLNNASAFVAVSNELKNNLNFLRFMKPTIVIGNGFDFDAVKEHKKKFNDSLEFIFIGTPGQAWHGIDKLVSLAIKLKNHKFHIVGPSSEELSIFTGKKNDNIIVHGYCDQEYIERLIVKCDIGISTLALHRKNMDEASPLKSRQYLAHGLPIIVGYNDTDLPSDVDFILNIGNFENNIDEHMEDIKSFILKVKEMKPNEIIEQAKIYLDQGVKEEKRLKFFKDITNE